jgi:hypothetical protein
MTSPLSQPDVSSKLARAAAAAPDPTALAAERQALHEDLDSLRQREENLRVYERRLRELQAELDARMGASAATTRTPFATPAQINTGEASALKAGWEKLHRAREIFESEQTMLRDDRMAMREHEQQLQLREQALAEREERLAQLERTLSAASMAGQASTIPKASRSPFQFARTVLRGTK